MTTPATANLFRVEKGHAEPEELAALTAILLARATARPAEPAYAAGRTPVGWRRLEREGGFRAPHSWR
ncbi:acyl-CoA carboxylase epsilon subunit [Streptomyces sp. NPDC048717]|uniref:acyl-CoA carboxylase epsilon subunit n=1 Tax=unclassified Streptomyces TaxID=2593676 RepID=UPI0034465D63